MKFVELTEISGKKFTINSKNIKRFYSSTYNKVTEKGFLTSKKESIECTDVRIDEENAHYYNRIVSVKESYETIKKLLSTEFF